MIIKGKFSIVLHKNIYCGYSLESPRPGNSNKHPQYMSPLKHILWVPILMSTHNICFYGEITKIIPKLSSNTLLICSNDLAAHLF